MGSSRNGNGIAVVTEVATVTTIVVGGISKNADLGFIVGAQSPSNERVSVHMRLFWKHKFWLKVAICFLCVRVASHSVPENGEFWKGVGVAEPGSKAS